MNPKTGIGGVFVLDTFLRRVLAFLPLSADGAEFLNTIGNTMDYE